MTEAGVGVKSSTYEAGYIMPVNYDKNWEAVVKMVMSDLKKYKISICSECH